MFSVNYRIGMSDEFYSDEQSDAVYGSMIITAGESFCGYYHDADGAACLYDDDELDHWFESLLKSVVCIRNSKPCGFRESLFSSVYLCFVPSGDMVCISERTDCDVMDAFYEGEIGGEICMSENVHGEELCGEIISKAEMFLRELESFGDKYSKCRSVLQCRELIKNIS